MDNINLSTVDTNILRSEIARREKEEQEIETLKKAREEFKKWQNRPKSAIVGKAYSYGDTLTNFNLYSVSVRGNMGSTYPDSWSATKICHSVELYFHNAWGHEKEREFGQALQAVAEYYVTKYMNDPNLVATLICLSNHIPWNSLLKEEIQEEWHKAAIERMCEYSLDELRKALSKCKGNHFDNNGHGQEKLIKEAIEYKEGHNIQDKLPKDLPEELKTVVMISKLKEKRGK